jgi:hypothetical protein
VKSSIRMGASFYEMLASAPGAIFAPAQAGNRSHTCCTPP